MYPLELQYGQKISKEANKNQGSFHLDKMQENLQL